MSISLAANGIPDLYAVLEQEEALPLDHIKCPLSPQSRPEVERALALRPVLLHGWGPPRYSVTRPELPEPELLRALSARSGTPHLSVHLDPAPALDGALSEAELLRRVAAQAEQLRQLSGVPLLLENMPWYPWRQKPGWGVDPAFIRRALEAAQAGLLLDLAHARVACWHLGQDVQEYLQQLPLERVREIHVSGPRLEQDGLRDRHQLLSEDDWALLAWTMERAPALTYLTHEYLAEGQPEQLRIELQRLGGLTR
ncbi:DUF692 family multinuclear iron-containing protein [Deinococcus sonorensis]|uniref:DUF692 family multinuclear iron-containing protein n=2 Tax=Deinococcus sonorensis TaxID=309891 RepID=A0AAU7U891_9DEIO